MTTRTQTKKKLRTIYLVSQFVSSRTIKDLDAETINRVFGNTLKIELRYLLTVGLLKQDNSFATRMKSALNAFLFDIPLQSSYIKATSKGRAIVRGFEKKLALDRQQSHEDLDVYLERGDYTNAVNVLRTFYYGNAPVTPSIWGESLQPKTIALLALRNIFDSKVNIVELSSLNDDELNIIKLQAMELCLADTVLIDRLPNIKRNLHKNGNAWFVNRLKNEALQQALLTQSYQGNIVENASGDNPQIQSDGNVINESGIHTDISSSLLLPKVRTSIRFKITIPYIILATIISIVGAFILSQALLDSIEQRFFNQLIETGKLAADRMVIEENRLLETMRLIANTEGVPEAIKLDNAEQLRELILPLAVNSQQLAIEVLDSNGISLLSMRRDANDPIEAYEYSRGEHAFASWEIVTSVLKRLVDENNRDKYAGFVRTNWGDYFYTAGPIVDDTGTLFGVVLIGKPLDILVKEFREDTLAHVSLYTNNGSLLSSSLLFDGQTNHVIGSTDVATIIDTQDEASMMRSMQVASVSYRELLGPWEARNGQDLGIMGTALPESFLVNPSNNTRIQIFVLLLMGLSIIIAIGVFIARRITRPLKSVVDATQQVAQGYLNISIKPQGHDEIALLAHAFNHMVVGLQEVTERRFREIELVQQIEKERDLRELKSRFVSMVSHEFRTPLATILSSSDFVRKYGYKVSEDKKEKHFNRIETAVQNMTELLEDVLLIGRTEAGRLEFNPESMEIVSFCYDISEEMQMNASLAHQIVFQAEIGTQNINLDPRLMRIALTNLLSNAVKYSPDGGEVKFDLSKRENHIVIRVADTGIGIPKKDQERLFTPFSRAGNVGSIGGTGLGLYITKMIVELHDGAMEVDSDVGKGTAFIVSLPFKS